MLRIDCKLNVRHCEVHSRFGKIECASLKLCISVCGMYPLIQLSEVILTQTVTSDYQFH